MTTTTRAAAGAQTLARGIRVLREVAQARDGMTIQEVAERQEIHRTIASRILSTLAAEGLVHRNADGRYRGAAGLATLASAAHAALRSAAMEVLDEVAEQLDATATLLVEQGDEAVALAVVTPSRPHYRIVFAEGSRHPLHLGAAGLALLCQRPEHPSDSPELRQTRADGVARTFAQVEPGMYGVAAPLGLADPVACLNLITNRPEHLDQAAPILIDAAARITRNLEQG